MQKKTSLPINDKINIDENLTEIIPIWALSQFGVKKFIHQNSVVFHSKHNFCSISQNLVSDCKLINIKKSFPVFLKLFV
ncbi:MAG: hypothetical protein CVU41_11980 [Chloroflexi bacterium HGW-Chloroflexi-3]|nr:MAG: hypothetical protein CVU41_11980 [Chloroflexi bacterium HGW-Chloroflexi-3]